MTFCRTSDICPHCRRPQRLKGELTDIHGRPFSPRERQIMALISVGKTNKEIGQELHISEGTVKSFIGTMLRKSGTENRTEMAFWWSQKSDNPSN
jgi:DNA-binding NarL/FixJ family response regulator